VKQLGQLLADPAAREIVGTAPPSAWSKQLGGRARPHARRPRTVSFCNCGSRWERRMREPAFWYRPIVHGYRSYCRRSAHFYGLIAAQRLQREGL